MSSAAPDPERTPTTPTADEPVAAEQARLGAEVERAEEPEVEQPEAEQPAPTPEAAAPTPPAPERIQPDGVPDRVDLHTPGGSATRTVLLGVAALVAAGVTVWQAYLDRLAEPTGIAAAVATVVLVIAVGRVRVADDRVWLEQGVLHVEEDDTHRRFDLTTPDTIVEMIGRPGTRGWKVLILRKGMAPYEVNAGLVEPEEFLAAVRPYRPNL